MGSGTVSFFILSLFFFSLLIWKTKNINKYCVSEALGINRIAYLAVGLFKLYVYIIQ